MARRILTALFLLAILAPVVYIGGIAYFVLVAGFLSIAAWEYCRMFQLRGHEPVTLLTVGAVMLSLAARAFVPAAAAVVLTIEVLAIMVVHLIRFERGRDPAAVDLAISAAGIVYLGWIGAYLLDLRLLPDGLMWLVTVLVTVWLSDTAAYFVGVRLGRHKLSRRLSPRKSWEGYGAGVIAGTATAVILTWLLGRAGLFNLGIVQSAALGFVLSALTTLGDLGESLFKRYAGIKDSGTWLPGHGGAFDRVDSLIWAGALGYLWIRFVLL